jgi:alpha-tubulin suppressor-like RCC1 family protein
MNLAPSWSSVCRFSALVDENGELYVWGSFSKLEKERARPRVVKLPGVQYSVKSVAMGTDFMLVLTEEGPLFSWGRNGFGQLGTGDAEQHGDVQHVKFPAPEPEIKHIACGDDFAMAVTTGGKLFGWACNNHGQAANYDCETHYVPTLASQIGPSGNVVVASVSCGCQHSMILAEDGSLYGTGCNYQGQLGLGDMSSRKQIEQIQIPKVRKVLCGNFETSTLTEDGSIYIWGDDKHTLPQQIIFSGVEDYIRGLRFHIAMMQNGDLKAWGFFDKVELGQESMDSQGFFNLVLPKPHVPVVSWISGADFVLAVRQDRTVLCWGSNTSGQLGVGDKEKRIRIEQIPSFRAATVYKQVRWIEVMKWLFLGRQDENSSLYQLPMEVLFHFCSLRC